MGNSGGGSFADGRCAALGFPVELAGMNEPHTDVYKTARAWRSFAISSSMAFRIWSFKFVALAWQRLPVVNSRSLSRDSISSCVSHGARSSQGRIGCCCSRFLHGPQYACCVYNYYCYVMGVTRTSPVRVITVERSSNGAFVTPLVRCATRFVG
jgi:hypothetical protein